MRFSCLVLSATFAIFPACVAADFPDENANGFANGKADSLASNVPDCVIDTIHFDDALEFAGDLAAAIDPALIVDFGAGFNRQVQIPLAMQAPLPETDGWGGGYLYSFHGWDVVPGALLYDFVDDETGLYATISGRPVVDAKRKFAHDTFLVSRALFEAMTEAGEIRTDHVVPPEQFYDRSWVRFRRATANNRLVCDMVLFPDEGDDPTYTCVVSKVLWKTVQAFDTDEAGGFCPTPQQH